MIVIFPFGILGAGSILIDADTNAVNNLGVLFNQAGR